MHTYPFYSKTCHLRSLVRTATYLVRPLHEVKLLCNFIDLIFILPLFCEAICLLRPILVAVQSRFFCTCSIRQYECILLNVAFLYFPVNVREYFGLSGRSKTGSRSELIDKHSVKVINPFYSRLFVVDRKSLYKCVTITPCNNAVINHL